MTLALLLLASGTAGARPLRGLVYADTSGDGRPSVGEPGVPGWFCGLAARGAARPEAGWGFRHRNAAAGLGPLA